jgi:hypothetical protein
MLEPRHLTTLWSSTACDRESFTFYSRGIVDTLIQFLTCFPPLKIRSNRSSLHGLRQKGRSDWKCWWFRLKWIYPASLYLFHIYCFFSVCKNPLKSFKRQRKFWVASGCCVLSDWILKADCSFPDATYQWCGRRLLTFLQFSLPSAFRLRQSRSV